MSMQTVIDWLGVVLFQMEHVWVSARMTLDGEVLSYYATCQKHGTQKDVSKFEAYMISDPVQFCEKCQNNQPSTDWNKTSPFVQALIDFLNSSEKTVEINCAADDVTSFIGLDTRQN